MKEDEPRSERLYFYTTATKAKRLRTAGDSVSDIVNRLVDGWADRENGRSDLARIKERIQELETTKRPLDEELQELYARQQAIEDEEADIEAREEQERAWRALVRDGPSRRPAQWRAFAEARAEARAIGLERALEIVEEEEEAGVTVDA